jgi:hypothetical protein
VGLYGRVESAAMNVNCTQASRLHCSRWFFIRMLVVIGDRSAAYGGGVFLPHDGRRSRKRSSHVLCSCAISKLQRMDATQVNLGILLVKLSYVDRLWLAAGSARWLRDPPVPTVEGRAKDALRSPGNLIPTNNLFYLGIYL